MLNLRSPLFKIIALYLVFAVLFLSMPVQGWAMLMPTHRESLRDADVAVVRTTLESAMVKQRLMDYGLTAEETAKRLEMLSDEQVHQLAADIDALQAGGDAGSFIITVLIIAILIIVVLELTGHHVVMKK